MPCTSSLTTLISLSTLLHSLGARVASTKYSRRKTAAVRYVATMQPRSNGFIHFPTVGVITLLAAFWLLIAGESTCPSPRRFLGGYLISKYLRSSSDLFHLVATPQQSGPSLNSPTTARGGTSARHHWPCAPASSLSESSPSSSCSEPNGASSPMLRDTRMRSCR